MASYINTGDTVQVSVAANGTALSAGDITSVGKLVAFCPEDIAVGKSGTGYITGAYTAAKTGAAVTKGALLNWDASASAFTVADAAAAGDVTAAAIALHAVNAAATEVEVRFSPGSGS